MPRPRDDDYDDEDYRPRRRRDEDSDDEDDYRPRRKVRRRKAASGPPVGLIVALAAGVVFVGLMMVGLAVYALVPSSKPAPVAAPRPAVPQPAAEPPPAPKAAPKAAPKGPSSPAPAASPAVTITAARRGTGFAGKPTLEIDYTLAGRVLGGRVVVKIKGPDGTITEANVFGAVGMRPGQDSGTWTIEQFGFMGGGFAGRLEVWVERKMGLQGEVVSNIFTLE